MKTLLLLSHLYCPSLPLCIPALPSHPPIMLSILRSFALAILLTALLLYLDNMQRLDQATIPTTMPLEPQKMESNTTTTSSWPGQPIYTLTKDLKLLRIGDDENGPVHDARGFLFKHLNEFLEVYKNRPDKSNTCGIRINHSLAIYTVTKRLQPTTIIESGVNSGQSTYFFRKAAPNARIISIDPLEKPICGQAARWIDDTNNEYLTGDDFVDFDAINWQERIKRGKLDPSSTLVFVDDHIGFFKRFPTFVRHGFRHLINEDNYKLGKGATPGDRQGYAPKQMYAKPNNDDTIWLFHNLKRYAEFPPLVPPIVTSHKTKRQGGFLHHTDDLAFVEEPLLRPDISGSDKEILEKICSELGVDADMKDSESYQELMGYNFIAYMELVPLSPQLVAAWKLQ